MEKSTKILKQPLKYFIDRYKSIKNFDFRQYTKTNILFLAFVITNLINSIFLRFVTIHNYFSFKPIIADATFLILIGCFAYLIKGQKQFRYFFTVSIILSTICAINSAYYTYYTSFASFSLLSTLTQLAGVADAVTKNVVGVKDIIYVWQPITLYFIHKKLINKNYYPRAQRIESKQKRFSRTLTFSVVAFIIFFLTCSTTDLSRLYKQWNREFTVTKFGIYTYQINDLFKTINSSFAATFGQDNAKAKFDEYYEQNKSEKKTNKYTNIFKDKNIIIIHAESLQTFMMNVKLNNVEATPNLNKLAKEGIFCSNFYSQVSTGTSSDSEFTLNTSLMPINNGTVFVSYWNRTYLTLQKLLKEQGYYSFSMHGNNATYWNRLVMHKKFGYDDFFAKDSYNIDEVIGLGIADTSFLSQSADKIKEISEKKDKFVGTLITLTNHTPFYDVSNHTTYDVTMKYTATDENGTETENVASYLENTTIGNYMKSVHYSDYALGQFIDKLDSYGILDDTVIVLYGDHDARLSYDNYTRMYNYDPVTDTVLDEDDPEYKKVSYYDYELNRKVPFIIWSKGSNLNTEISTAMGMYDVLPTLANIFGFNNSPYALGHDIMNLDNNLVAFPNGNWLTNDLYYNAQKDEFSLINDNTTVSQEEINKNIEKTDQMLSVSQSIVIYDLLKENNK